MSFLRFLSTIPGLGPFSLRCSDSERFSLVCLMCKFQTIIEQKYATTVFSGSYAMNHQFQSSRERSEDISTSTQSHQRQIGFLLSPKFQQHVGCVVCWSRILVELPQEVFFFQKAMAVRGKEYLVLEQNCAIVAFSDAWSAVWHGCSCHRGGLAIPWTTGLQICISKPLETTPRILHQE